MKGGISSEKNKKKRKRNRDGTSSKKRNKTECPTRNQEKKTLKSRCSLENDPKRKDPNIRDLIAIQIIRRDPVSERRKPFYTKEVECR